MVGFHHMKKRYWLWVLLFVCLAVLLATLATGWNFVLVHDYQQMVELAHAVAQPGQTHAPWGALALGSLGFLAVLGITAAFLVKILNEMRANHRQSEFLAAVSHELKTPIGALELSSSLIRSGIQNGDLPPEDVEKLWQAHDHELHRLREEVETLLLAARCDAGAPPEKCPVAIESWISDSISRWAHILGPEAQLKREGEPLPVTSELDLRTLNLITDNILDNARKFSKGPAQVIIRTERLKRHRWRIEFRDSGWGFDPRDERRIFNRFERAKTTAPYAIPGTGLGLHLVATACKQLGLTIKARSPGKGQGAVFTLEGRSA